MEEIEKIFGIHACISVLNNQNREISKILCTKDVLKKIQAKVNNQKILKNIRILKRQDLDTQLKTTIHQGIVVYTKKKKILKIKCIIKKQILL